MNSKRKNGLVRLALVSLFAAILCISGMLTIPLPIAPITLQTFAVFLCLFILGGRDGSIAVSLYVAIGALGVPVFSGFSGGVHCLLSPNGGFIFGFIIAALSYWLVSALLKRLPHERIVAGAISLLVIYLCGVIWYLAVYGEWKLGEALLYLVVPFLIPDGIKIGGAYAIALAIERHVGRIDK